MRFVKRNANKCMTWGGVLLNRKGIIPAFAVILTILTILISVGYSALNQNLSVSGEAFLRAKDNIRISRIELSDAANDGYETYNPEYSKRTTKMYTTLPKDNSSVTYTVKVTNSTGVKYKVGSIEVTSTNSNVSCTPSIEVNTILEDGITEFTVTANYENGMSQDTNLNACDIKYEFVPLDVTPPTLAVQLVSDNGNTKTIKITAIDEAEGSGLSPDNIYKYYLSTSETELLGGIWKEYVNSTEFEISGDTEVRYLWIYPVKDRAGNISGGNSSVEPYSVDKYIFIDDVPTLYNVIAKEALTDGVAKLYTGQHNDAYDESGTKKVFHFYGADDNKGAEVLTKNNVIFGGFCWQMLRTTDTGGTKLIYNGVPKEQDGKKVCTNSGTEQQIGESVFNEKQDSPAYVGYMYNNVYSSKSKDMNTVENVFSIGASSLSTSCWYADSISYDSSTGKYSLVNPYKVTNESDFESLKGKYTFNSSNETYTSSRVHYIAGISNNYYYNITLSGGNTIEYYDDIYTYGTNYTKNEDGTYTINEPSTIQKTTYYDNYADLKGKYVCKNAVNNSCNALWYVATSSKTTFYWINPEVEYKYAKGFTYVDGKYILNDESFMVWNISDSIEEGKLNDAHYTCFNTTGECEIIHYAYYLDGGFYEISLYYIELKDGKSVENALNEMLSADNVNQTNSIIKDTIDAWYASNMTDYTKYLEDTVFCNDRSISYYDGWNPNGGSITSYLYFKNHYFQSNDLYCTNVTDRFSVGNEKAKLTYPVGLISPPEMNLIGNDNIRKTGRWYYLSSAYGFPYVSAIRSVSDNGLNSSYGGASGKSGVRPSVSVAPGTRYAAGTGSTTDPYIVDVNAPIVTQETLIDGEREKTVRITVSDDYGLSSENKYKYYLSTSETEFVGGEWKDYASGEIFTITGENETRYLWIYPVMDNAGNINDGKSDINTPYVLSAITFKDKTYLYDVLQKEYASGSGLAQLYTGQHNDAYNETGTQNIYHFYGADDTAATSVLNKNNVLFAGFCWQMIRTTDTGGVKLIYNGKLKEYIETVPISESEYNVTSNDTNYPYTYDSSTNAWTSTVKTRNSSGTIIFTVKTAGDYYLNYTVSSEDSYDIATFYKNGTQIGEYSGSVTGQINLGSLLITDEIKVVYSSRFGSFGSDNVVFYVGKSNGKVKQICNNSGTEQDIESGTSTFNVYPICPAHVGYMYNTVYSYKYKSMSSSQLYKYANSFTYSNGTYKLSSDAVSIDVTNSTENTKLNNAHYTCFNTIGECETIFYIYVLDDVKVYYVELQNGKSVEDALSEMLYTDNVNQTNSTIKDTVDTWYANNMTNYTKYLEDTVFCNDRSIADYGGWNSNGGSVSSDLQFKNYNITNDLYCTNVTDRFSVGNEKARLTYKVGLMSAPEMNLLGNNSIRNTGASYWLASPYYFYEEASGRVVYRNGSMSLGRTSDWLGVRPAVSLAPGTQYTAGTGSTTDPYVIKTS